MATRLRRRFTDAASICTPHLGSIDAHGDFFRYSCALGDGSKGGGGDFVAGFLLGGAIFGTLAYIFAPQIRKSVLNENEDGSRKGETTNIL